MDNKYNNGYVNIDVREYKELILKEKELEEAKLEIDVENIKIASLKVQLEKAREEVKSLLLMLLGNRTTQPYDNHEFEGYHIASSSLIATYINKNYNKDGILQFEKITNREESE